MMDNQQDGRPGGLSSCGPSPAVSAVPASIPDAALRHVFYVPIELAIEPESGECLARHWWTVHPEKGLAFYGVPTGYYRSDEPSPQCNSSEETARLLSKRLYPGHDVRFIDVVFLRHAQRVFANLRAQAIEARRAETQSGSVADESAVGNADAPNRGSHNG